MVRANISSVLEPFGLSGGDGKRPDGMTLIPWQGGKIVTWDVTVTDTVADSHLHLSAACVGSAAEGAASRKITTYAGFDYSYTFIPLAFETDGPIRYRENALRENVNLSRTVWAMTREHMYENGFLCYQAE